MTGFTVVAEDLRRTFNDADVGEVVAVDDLSMRVREGELTALVGPDGAGKTTLMRMFAGLLKPQSGSLSVWIGMQD